MRILIDECLNWRLGRALTGHFFSSVHPEGMFRFTIRDVLWLTVVVAVVVEWSPDHSTWPAEGLPDERTAN